MEVRTFNLDDLSKGLPDDHWAPLDISQLEAGKLQIVAVKGENKLHAHDTLEFFLVFKGAIIIETEKKAYSLHEGEGIIVPPGTLHRRIAKKRAIVLFHES